MAKRRQRPKKKKENLLSTYTDPRATGALGGLRRFARAQRLSQAQARDALRKSLAFTLHRPPRRRFKMAPVMVLNIDQQWVAILPSLVQRYNENVHRSIGMAPKDVTVKNEAEVWQRLYGQVTKTRRRGRLKAGDKVRLSERVKTFKKGYLPQWTEEVFRIQRVIQGPVLMYKVEEFYGTPVKGTFYAEDLQKVTVDDDMLWRVEKVLKRRRGQMLVRWKGWPAKYDSWIKAS